MAHRLILPFIQCIPRTVTRYVQYPLLKSYNSLRTLRQISQLLI